ncbi:MAG: sigma-70 family RNA polymerase sigma factor [Acidobacteria bacterium]|nr:sigma-70 family RNA polymerase sigma factor [Acidobacteriota bacterium]
MLRLQGGDTLAFNVLVEKYRAPVIHFLYRIVHETALAEELAQEVFLRVYRARTSYRPRAKFTTWLFRIATNVALNALRDGRMRRARETSLEGREETTGAPVEVADPEGSVEQKMLEAERRAQIRQAVEALPEKQRLAVLLHKYQELDYAEIAEILDCSESALKSLLFRAYETLRVRLRPLLGARA